MIRELKKCGIQPETTFPVCRRLKVESILLSNLLATEESHHLHHVDGPVNEEGEVEDNVKLGTEFNVLAGQHGWTMQTTDVLVKDSVSEFYCFST